MKCNLLILAAFIITGPSLSAHAPLAIKEFTKTISQNYSISSDGEVAISNKYGDIDIETTDGSSVEFEITITVEARNDERGEELLDRINVTFDHSSQRVEATTEIDDKKGWKWKKDNESFKIDYKVRLPKSNRLILSNKYGDIAVAELENDAEISLKYGNGNLQSVGGDLELSLGYVKSFHLNDVSGDLDIDAAYSDVNIGSTHAVEINSKYSNYELDKADEMDIRSAYDEFDLGRVGTFRNVGKYDKINIDHVGTMQVETRYSQIKVRNLGREGNFETGYGSVAIQSIDDGFTSIKIESRYTGYTLDVDQSFKLDIDTKHVSVSVPDEMSFSERIKDNTTLVMKGYYRNQGGGTINAVMHYGHLKLND